MSKVGTLLGDGKRRPPARYRLPENLAMVEKVLATNRSPAARKFASSRCCTTSVCKTSSSSASTGSQPLKAASTRRQSHKLRSGVDSVTKVPFAAGAVGNTLTFMNLSKNFDITAVARCLQDAKDARLLADPNVAVLENEEAVLEKVSEIPYQQLTQTQQGGDIGTTAFKKVGITLM